MDYLRRGTWLRRRAACLLLRISRLDEPPHARPGLRLFREDAGQDQLQERGRDRAEQRVGAVADQVIHVQRRDIERAGLRRGDSASS